MGGFIVDVGGGTTEVAAVAGWRVVRAESLRMAGNVMDEAIVNFAFRPEVYWDRAVEVKPTRQAMPGSTVIFTITGKSLPFLSYGGSSCIAQAALSRLWTCCSVLKSPESQVKCCQRRNWNSISEHFGLGP